MTTQSANIFCSEKKGLVSEPSITLALVTRYSCNSGGRLASVRSRTTYPAKRRSWLAMTRRRNC
jgi:hypothetical protein